MKGAELECGRAGEIAKRFARECEDVAQSRRNWASDPAAGLGGIGAERLVFLDECGVPAKPKVCAWTNMALRHGRSLRGTRACAVAPFGHWTRLTVLVGALGGEGMVGAMSVEAAASTAVFHAFLDKVLLPELRRTKPDAVLIMDNLAAHKAPAVRALLDASGFEYRYLPAYSPDPDKWLSAIFARTPSRKPGPR